MNIRLLPLLLAASILTPLAAVASAQVVRSPGQAQPVRTAANVARLPASDARLTRLESLMLQHVNSARASQGLPALTLDPVLSEVSRAHSAEMRDKAFFAHESPTEELRNPLDRYRLGYGRTPRLVAENIFRSWGSRREIRDADALRAHSSLMNSPGHKANILRSGPTIIGIGFVANANGDIWVTQMFARP